MIYAVLLTSKSMALFKPLVREIRARRIPCHVSVFQSIPELIDSNSFDYADIVLIDASLLNASALTEGLMRGAMGRRMVVFGRMACERTARILSEAGVQCRPHGVFWTRSEGGYDHRARLADRRAGRQAGDEPSCHAAH